MMCMVRVLMEYVRANHTLMQKISKKLLTFRSTQVVPGLSGSPVMNIRTRKVCGIVKRTRDETTNLGGRAVPSRIILNSVPNMGQLRINYHKTNNLWAQILNFNNKSLDQSHKLTNNRH